MERAPTTVLPIPLRDALIRIGSKLERQQSIEGDLNCALQGLYELPADVAVKAEQEITNAAKLSTHWRRTKSWAGWLWPCPTDMDLLKRLPGIEYLFIFHADGRIREAALQKIGGALPGPFLFAEIAWRLNDWALPVRVAAAECAKRTFPPTSAETIAQAATVLLSRQDSWSRWTDERAVLLEAFSRSDVVAALAEIVEKKRTGSVASVLQHAFQTSRFDPFLERLARKAAQPAARAAALQAVIDGYASWPSGFAWQWVDKSMGVRRRVRTFSRRPLTLTLQRRTAIAMGAADRSAAVKKVALDALTRYRSEIPDAKQIAEPLLVNRTASVRERAEFLLTRIAEAA